VSTEKRRKLMNGTES